jgi:outer membrane protein assembly factor BamA
VGELRPIDLELRQGWHRLASMDASLRWDGRSTLRRAGQGGRVALDLSLSSPAIGSQYEYAKVIVGGAYTFRLPWGHWITPSATGGQVVGRAPRFERFYAGDLSAWTPGRELGLIYSTRTPIDVFGTGVDAQPFASIVGRLDLEYSIPLFRTTRLRFVDAGHFFFAIGTYGLAGKPAERRQRRADGLPSAGVGINADLGLRIDTRIGPIVISVGNVLRRTPL